MFMLHPLKAPRTLTRCSVAGTSSFTNRTVTEHAVCRHTLQRTSRLANGVRSREGGGVDAVRGVRRPLSRDAQSLGRNSSTPPSNATSVRDAQISQAGGTILRGA
jgi:hypothetical protein